MNYKQELQQNNSSLQNLIDVATNLPNAGGGGSLPLFPEEGQITCTINYTSDVTSSATQYSTLNISGYRINDQGFIEGFIEHIPLSSAGGDSGTVTFTILRNSVLEFYNSINWSSGIGSEAYLDITAIYLDGSLEDNALNSMMVQ